MADSVGDVLAGIAPVGDMTAAFQDEGRYRRLLEAMMWPRGHVAAPARHAAARARAEG
jgi:hypothetical protein